MTEEQFGEVLVDLSEFVKLKLEEGIHPNDIIMALEQCKFTMMTQLYRQSEAFLMIHGVPPVKVR